MYLDLRSVLEHIKLLEADLTNHQSMGEDTYPSQKHNPTHQGILIKYDSTTMLTSIRYSNLIIDY